MVPQGLGKVVTPFKGWCQTVPSEANPRHILSLDYLVRRGLEDRGYVEGLSLSHSVPVQIRHAPPQTLGGTRKYVETLG